jgi:hypothetical protein
MKTWTEEEIAVLTTKYENSHMNELKSLLPSKSSQAIRKKAKEIGLQYNLANYITPEKYYSIKKNAQSRKIEFNIDMRDISEVYEKQNKKCALTGKDLIFDGVNNYFYVDDIGIASVDRIDNSKGYTKDNIQIVDKFVNLGRNILSNEDYIQLCELVVNFNRKKNENGH